MKNTKIIIGVISGAICVLLLLLFIHALLFGEKVTSNNISDYRKWTFPSISNLLIFPKDLNNHKNANYSYYYQDTFLDRTYEIFLECAYDEEGYSREIERLSKLSVNNRGAVKDIRYDTDNYKYPAYVAIKNWDSCDEYALLNDDAYTIIYVFLQQPYGGKLDISKEYLPITVEEKVAYNMYAFNVDGISYHIAPNEE